jgi:23S rRNA G2445 N2-methylase RlmL
MAAIRGKSGARTVLSTRRLPDAPAISVELRSAFAGADERAYERALRELSRRGFAMAEYAAEQLVNSEPPLRARWCALIAQVARTEDARAQRFLLAALKDSDARTRRTAISALGRMRAPNSERPLLDALAVEEDRATTRALLQSLGKLGGAESLEPLARFVAADPETARVLGEARMKLERDLSRNEQTSIDAERELEQPLPIHFHCRAGLEALVERELLAAELQPRVLGPALVSARLAGRLSDVFRSRVAIHVGFPLPEVAAPGAGATEHAVVGALTSDYAMQVLRTFTRGPIRYRLHWQDAGHRRGLTYRVASAVSARRPELVNDPQQSPWEARVSVSPESVRVELCPRRLEDPRFWYRVADVPAASHPTIAAALAISAGVRPHDFVWDPCVGSGLELAERGLLGPYAALWGTDLAPAALDAARRNLEAARVSGVQLVRADARHFKPPRPVDLLITNPPFGRRAHTASEVESFYGALLENARSVLAPGGRLVWISPLFEVTVRLAERLGLRTKTRRRVDMGGFKAELQLFVNGQR